MKSFCFTRQSVNLYKILFLFSSPSEISTWRNDNDYDSKTIKIDKEYHTIQQSNNENDDNKKSSSDDSSSPAEEILEEDMESEMTDDDDKKCLHCLCMTINECRPSSCNSMPCGKYMISQFYWLDAGKPRVDYETDYQNDAIGKKNKCNFRNKRKIF